MTDKIKLLLLPFLFIFFGFMIGYTFLHWLLLIKFELLPLKEAIATFLIPCVLTAIAAWFVLRPNFKVLNILTTSGDLRDLYSFILWLILCIPLIISQEYMKKSSGQLTQLNSINELDTHSLSKYYTLKEFYLNKNSIGLKSTFEVSGKRNDKFNMKIFIVLPIFKEARDTISLKPKAWLGFKYAKTISNSLEIEEKETAYENFLNESLDNFESKDITNFVYLDRIGYSSNKDGYLEAMHSNLNYQPSDVVFQSVNTPFNERKGNLWFWLIGSSVVGFVIWLSMILFPKINQKELKRIQQGKPDVETQNNFKSFIEFIKLKEGFFITPLLIYINLAVFLWMLFSGLGFFSFQGQDLLNWGANYGPVTKNGEWWRLVSSLFLHSGIVHLINNLFGLFLIGIFLEPFINKTRFLMLYLLCGIVGSLSSLWWNDATLSIGASGAIFGLYGAFISLSFTNFIKGGNKNAFFSIALIYVGINLLLGIFNAVGNIDNAAHIGGLLCGLAIGYIWGLIPKLNSFTKK